MNSHDFSFICKIGPQAQFAAEQACRGPFCLFERHTCLFQGMRRQRNQSKNAMNSIRFLLRKDWYRCVCRTRCVHGMSDKVINQRLRYLVSSSLVARLMRTMFSTHFFKAHVDKAINHACRGALTICSCSRMTGASGTRVCISHICCCWCQQWRVTAGGAS